MTEDLVVTVRLHASSGRLSQAIAALGVVVGRRPRWRVLRLWALAAVFCLGKCLCVLGCLLLGLAGPVPRWRDEDRWRARHVQILS